MALQLVHSDWYRTQGDTQRSSTNAAISPAKHHAQHLLPLTDPALTRRRTPNYKSYGKQRTPDMSDRAKELKRMKKGKLMIESLSFGFFGIEPHSDDEETATPSAGTSKAERQQYEQPNDIPMSDQDDTLHQIIMYPSGQAQGERFQATLDTGSAANWISMEALRRLGLQPSIQAQTEFIDFNGKTISSREVVSITWNGIGSRRTRVTDFRVAPETPFESAPFDVLIGKELLFQEKILQLDNEAWVMAKKPATKGNMNRNK